MLSIGSLFSGIGGLELGLEWAGLGPVVWQVECDKYALKVLEKHWPEVERFNDITKVGKHNLKPVDLVCGGFPCQDISVAGKKAGLEKGKRSSLWFEMFRIIGELRPRYALIENVPGIYVSGLNRVLSDLAQIGYNAEWTHLSAKEVGAPHLRNRVFIVAHPEQLRRRGWHNGNEGELCGTLQVERSGSTNEQKVLADTISDRWKSDNGGRTVPDQNGNNTSSIWEPQQQSGIGNGSQESNINRGGRQINRASLGNVESDLGRVGDGASFWLDDPADSGKIPRVATGTINRVDRLRCLGNAVVPQVAQVIGKMIINYEERQAYEKVD